METLSFLDYPDNHSHCIVLFFPGCSHCCNNCHNPLLQLWQPIVFDLDLLSKKYKTKKIVLSGGDPLYPLNIGYVRKLLFNNNSFDYCIYTGYDIDYVKQLDLTGFKYIKCGKYDEQLKQIPIKTNEYIQFSSSNQELYNANYDLLSNGGRYVFK
jgi:organic radical activating enzyme